MSKVRYTAAALGTLAVAATSFIVAWEGNKTKPYLDVGGVPTVCAGVTSNIDMLKIYSPEECQKLNAETIQKHALDLKRCVTAALTQDEWIALISLTYNTGAANVCKSTLVKKANAGQQYCDEYLKWNKVNGVEVKGLTNRRKSEQLLCLKGTEK